jgi:hypothetical protein
MSDVPSDWRRASMGPSSELSTSLRALSDEFRSRAESKDGEDVDVDVRICWARTRTHAHAHAHTGTF